MHASSGRAVAAALLALLVPAGAAYAQPPATYFTLSDLKALFITQQQYFILDTEGSETQSLNHLHITQLDPTSGAFQGQIWAPQVPPYGSVPQLTLPVTGTIAVAQAQFGPSYGYGNFYQISFSWNYAPNECENETATYTGTMQFLGYQGSGKMHGIIGGSVVTDYSGCLVGGFELGPVPFSGTLTK